VNTTKVSWALVTGPASEPITLVEAKQHARITQDNDDATIQRFIVTARETGEEYMNRGFFTQTWQMTLDWWYDVMYLPRAAPLQSVTTVQYYDTAGALQTLATSIYDTDTVSRPARIVLKPGQNWPALQSTRFTPRVIVTYVIGWTSVALIPERIKQGIRMYVAYLDCDREGLEEYREGARMAAENCWSDRVHWIEPQDWLEWSMTRSS
jgi:uncharacterized phiE125 gp8 family phage protein